MGKRSLAGGSSAIRILANKIKDGKATESEKNTFYDLIVKFVRQQANKYTKTIKDIDVEDLINIGFLHIIKNIFNYNDEFAFTTWAYYCLKSAYTIEYNLYKKRGFINLGNDLFNHKYNTNYHSDFSNFIVFDDNDQINRMFMRDVIRDLFNNVGKIKILKEMFGNPFKDDYVIPKSISVVEVARNLGIDHSKVNVFWCRRIKPYLRMRLEEFVNG